jgi:hypothetical protein
VLFAAEWGDLSQLLTAGLVAAGRAPVPVFVGSWVALAVVAGAGVVLGRVLRRRIRLSVIRYVGRVGVRDSRGGHGRRRPHVSALPRGRPVIRDPAWPGRL